MRLLITADLHYNHARSRPLAEDVIEQINTAGGDVLLVVGDTAVADGDALEQCLGRFRFAGPKLFVAGNHELWTRGHDSYQLFTQDLPRRVRELGWRWLEGDPFVAGDVAIVGSVGWYDYSFAAQTLGIPDRFYAAKVSPGAALHLGGFEQLFQPKDDLPAHARELVARWNDGKFIKLGRDDPTFLHELLASLEMQLTALANVPRVVAAIHHVPLRDLLPPLHWSQWDFARAFLGSEKIGQLLLAFPNVTHLFCGHSHLPRETQIGQVKCVNIGSGYRWKTFQTLEA
jgi:predicted phosphodiesterase